jgi:hypothetical protein
MLPFIIYVYINIYASDAAPAAAAAEGHALRAGFAPRLKRRVMSSPASPPGSAARHGADFKHVSSAAESEDEQVIGISAGRHLTHTHTHSHSHTLTLTHTHTHTGSGTPDPPPHNNENDQPLPPLLLPC